MAEATVEEIAGFITGNVKRKQILDVLDKNERATYEMIRKLTRMPKLILDKAIKDMTEKGVITTQNDSFILTETGKKVANSLPKQSNKAGGHKFEANIHREI
jgi:predicted transcriptional regulator